MDTNLKTNKMDIKEMLNKHNELMENEIEALSTKLEILEKFLFL